MVCKLGESRQVRDGKRGREAEREGERESAEARNSGHRGQDQELGGALWGQGRGTPHRPQRLDGDRSHPGYRF